jgi:hypothetical protein
MFLSTSEYLAHHKFSCLQTLDNLYIRVGFAALSKFAPLSGPFFALSLPCFTFQSRVRP